MKFKVLLQQYVEQTAAIEVEAATPEAALEEVLRLVKGGQQVNWEDGDDAYSPEAYAVQDENGETVLER